MAKINDKKLWPVFSEYIRRRDAILALMGDELVLAASINEPGEYGKCFTCKRIIRWQDGDCGHGIGRQHWGTKYSEHNNHLQCKSCNGFEGGKREVYKEEMNRRYGQHTWDLMEMGSRKVCKWSQFEVEQLTIHYKNLLAAMTKQDKPQYL